MVAIPLMAIASICCHGSQRGCIRGRKLFDHVLEAEATLLSWASCERPVAGALAFVAAVVAARVTIVLEAATVALLVAPTATASLASSQ